MFNVVRMITRAALLACLILLGVAYLEIRSLKNELEFTNATLARSNASLRHQNMLLRTQALKIREFNSAKATREAEIRARYTLHSISSSSSEAEKLKDIEELLRTYESTK